MKYNQQGGHPYKADNQITKQASGQADKQARGQAKADAKEL